MRDTKRYLIKRTLDTWFTVIVIAFSSSKKMADLAQGRHLLTALQKKKNKGLHRYFQGH